MKLSVRPRGYLSLDISEQREAMPIMLFNDIDANKEPLNFEYLTHADQHLTNGTGCGCIKDCITDCLCAMKNRGEFAYNQDGFLLKGKTVIFECGPFCSCPSSCLNRVTQKGLKHRLEVFGSKETVWGVRSLDLIHAGAFICEYAGDVLIREEAEMARKEGVNLVYPSGFDEKWEEWGDLSQIYPEQHPSYPATPRLDFAIDVSEKRNVACYMSQSNTPNVMVQFVQSDHSKLSFPHLMLFATENIPPVRDLCLDYGVSVVDEWRANVTDEQPEEIL